MSFNGLCCDLYVVSMSVLWCFFKCVSIYLLKWFYCTVILVFTQVNKAPARSLSMCLGEDVMVLSGCIPASPTIVTKLQYAVATAATPTHLGFLNQSQPDPMDHGNHWPWQWAGTSHTGACHACVQHNPIKGQVYLTLCSLSGPMWLRLYLDLDTSCRHLPDCWFTQHQLVILSFHLSTSICQPVCQP